jgi:AraC-like DNA-binding protein
MLDEPTSEPVTLDAAAQQLQRSKAHLIRSFTARYGLAPHAYLIGRRVDAARKLLLQGMRPADVAAAVGFYDQSRLTLHFRRHTAMAPAAYAASHVSSAQSRSSASTDPRSRCERLEAFVAAAVDGYLPGQSGLASCREQCSIRQVDPAVFDGKAVV